MGCGQNKLPGFVNVDAFAACNPDEVVDLEVTPWPWPDNCAAEVMFYHSLEHMGASSQAFFGIMRELYRICAPGAEVVVVAPHPRHDNFIDDPTHVRIITPGVMSLFDRARNEDWAKRHCSNTPLGLYLGVDFRIVQVETKLAEPYATDLQEGRCNAEEIRLRLRNDNNVATEYRLRLRVHKDA